MPDTIKTIVAQDGSTAEIHKHANAVYSLIITSRHTGHCRFGTLAEIEQDTAHFIEFGKLPVSKNARMW